MPFEDVVFCRGLSNRIRWHYVPENFMASIMGKGAWWSVPLAVLVGVPMYSNAAGIIPVVQALLGKGAALGTVLAFMMAVIALSLPEAIILRKVLKPRLVGVFFGVVAIGIMAVGYGILLLLVYGVGHCSVIVLAGTFTEVVQHYLNWNERSRGAVVLKKVCGVLVLMGGLYLIYAAR